MEISILILWFALCVGVAAYAGKKGRSEIGFFLLSLFLSPLVGLLFVAAGHSNPQGMGLKKCSQCAEWVKPDALKCRFCGSDLALPAEREAPRAQELVVNPALSTGRDVQESKPSSGWSYVLAIVIVISIAIIFAVVNFSSGASSARANESAAISSLRLISTAATSYEMTYSRGYPAKLALLGPPAIGEKEGPFGTGLLDSALSAGHKDGYVFDYRPGSSVRGRVSKFQVIAIPDNGGENVRHFFIDETGVMRQSVSSDAGPSSPPIS